MIIRGIEANISQTPNKYKMITTKSHNYECCMCGDHGLSYELFRCKVCHFRSQHRVVINKMDLVSDEYNECNCILRKTSQIKRKRIFDGKTLHHEDDGLGNGLHNKRLCVHKCNLSPPSECTLGSSSSFAVDPILAGNGSTISKGELVRKLNNVVQTRVQNRKRQPNIVCRVEAFGRVCEHFDERRRRWVVEMGFGGLLHMVGLSLPRTLCYWLMTRVDPLKETIMLNDGNEYVLNPNQVRWVLGLPLGSKVIPRKSVDDCMKLKEDSILCKYGLERHGVIKATGKQIHSKGVTVSDSMVERLKGEWAEDEEEEFKVCFLMMSLYMVLCPTQSPCLEADLLPAVTLAQNADEYDWCSLVLDKLMASVSRFSKKFDSEGYAGGCGGCAIFVALYYLDRLHRKPTKWEVWPRLKAWSAAELRKACREDRLGDGGDFGKLKSVAAAYGELHPFDGGDKCAPSDDHHDPG